MSEFSTMTADELDAAVVTAYDLDPVNREMTLNIIKRRAKELGDDILDGVMRVDAAMRQELTKAEREEKRAIDLKAKAKEMQAPEDVLSIQDAPVHVDVEMSAGKPRPIYSNFEKIIRINPRYSTLRYNKLSGRIEIDGHNYGDADEAASESFISRNYDGLQSTSIHHNAIVIIANENAYDPLIDMLEALPPWDGVKRCDRFFIDTMLTDDTPYMHEIGRLFFAGGINRAYKPGCKFDDVLVMIGEQGAGKGTVARLLSMNEEAFYTNCIKSFDGKDAVEAIEGRWICELDEMGALKATKDREQAKSFITTQVDSVRKAYGRYRSDIPRRCVFIGSTNDHEFLTDPTGNRRFYPFEVHSKAVDMDHDAIAALVRLCWAEARDRFKANDPTFKPFADFSLIDDFCAAQRAATDVNPYFSIVEQYIEQKLAPKQRTCVMDIWVKCYGADLTTARDTIPQKITRDIAAMLDRIPSLRRIGTAHVGDYGRAKAWERIPITIPSPENADNFDVFGGKR